jgi:hypothetical protein
LQQIAEIMPIGVTIHNDADDQTQQTPLTALTAEERLIELRSNPKTFTTELDLENESVKKWLEEFNLESKTDEIAKLLEGENNKFAKLHSELGMIVINKINNYSSC